MAHIYGHSWPVRWGEAGELKLVKVYSNCASGRAVRERQKLRREAAPQRQDFPAAGLHWNVPFAAGDNTVRVVARQGKQTVTEDQSASATKPASGVSPARLTLTKTAEANGLTTIEAKLFDAQGVQCLDAANWLRILLGRRGPPARRPGHQQRLAQGAGLQRTRHYPGAGRGGANGRGGAVAGVAGEWCCRCELALVIRIVSFLNATFSTRKRHDLIFALTGSPGYRRARGQPGAGLPEIKPPRGRPGHHTVAGPADSYHHLFTTFRPPWGSRTATASLDLIAAQANAGNATRLTGYNKVVDYTNKYPVPTSFPTAVVYAVAAARAAPPKTKFGATACWPMPAPCAG